MRKQSTTLFVLILILLSAVVSALPTMAATGDPALINEVLASHSGTDNTEFVELFGTPGYSLSGLSLIVVEGGAFDPGRIDRRFDFKPFHKIGPNGFFLVGNCGGLPAVYGATPDTSLFTNYFENDSLTLALVETGSLSGGVGDLVTGSEVVRDAVALKDPDADEDGDQFFFGAPVIGPDGTFFPAGARRLVDGVDTDTPTDWAISSFFLPGANTPTGGGFDGCAPIPLTIPEIQGAGHISPYVGEDVTTTGVVTAVAFDSYYVQDPVGDGDDDTSDGIFVFKLGSKPNVGDLVRLTDTVEEFIPGGAGTDNLSTTEMSFPDIELLSTGNPLPDPVVIGLGGRVPPNVDVISDDELPVNLQTDPGVFNPENDGIDFYESLEGMLVTVEDAVAVSAVRSFGNFSSELFSLPNNGHPHIIEPKNARTDRGGINLAADPDGYGDLNPERVQIQFDASDIRTGTLYPDTVPAIAVGDRLGDVTGVMSYDFGNFEVRAKEVLSLTPAGTEPETTSLGGTKKAVTVASYNVLNLSPLSSDDNQRARLASQIVNNLGSPDVIALQEIQDNNGTINDGTTDATLTLQALVDAIAGAGGPTYGFFDVAPIDGTSGGVPGGNIRNAFLYNPDRVELGGFVSLTPDVLMAAGVGNPYAFTDTRNPLAATFLFDGEAFTVINNHLSSRSGSSPIFGGPQPFFQAAEVEREAQTQALNDYVDFLLEVDKDARVIVVGDFNTFDFTDDLTVILPGTLDGQAIMKSLLNEIQDDNRYTFIFDGNSQVLDHIFATRSLLEKAEFDIVHVNVDFSRRRTDTIGSDHEPLVARFEIR